VSRWRPPGERSTALITRAGHARLKAELDDLWRVQRPEAVKAPAAAAAEGDRSEHAEYTYRKKQLSGIDRRVRYLSKPLEAPRAGDTVPSGPEARVVGAWAEVEHATTGETARYRIVGPDETDPARGWISIDSPLARAMLKKRVDDEFEARLPAGPERCFIMDVRDDGWAASRAGSVQRPERRHGFAVQVVLVAAHELDVDEIAGLQAGLEAILDLHHAVDLGCVGHRARDRQLTVDEVHQAALHGADPGLELLRRDLRLHLHEPGQALLLHLLGHRVGKRVGAGALDRRIGERADAVEPHLAQEIQQFLERGLGRAGEADDEGAADREFRADVAPAGDPLTHPVDRAGPLHQLQDPRAGVLERDVQVRQQPALRHQRDHLVHVRV